MRNDRENFDASTGGFSLVELLLSLTITLVILGAAVAAFSGALSTRAREQGRTDAITSTQAALNLMSREIGNSGYGLVNNGIVIANSGQKFLRFRVNINNNNNTTTDPGEDITYYYEVDSQSVVRFDRNAGTTTGVINQVSDVDFEYHHYAPNGSFTTSSTPTATTGRVTIILKVLLPDVQGQPTGRVETVRSDVTLRNSLYHLGQY